VRSDIERKVLAGMDETERLGAAHYSREASYAVYEACLERADAALRAGHSVVLDAVFATPDERRSAEDLARRAGARFQGFWLEAPEEVLKSRVAARQGDASDATPEVVSRQMGYDLGQIGWRSINAAGSASQTTAQINAALTP
jgi:predicted kinase